MGSDIHSVVATVAVVIAASMRMFFLHFVVGMAFGTLFEFLALSGVTMVLETIWSIKMAEASRAKKRRRGGTIVIRTGLTDISVAGAAGPSFTGMLIFGTMIEPTITEMAPIALVHESAETIATLIMMVALEEHDLVGSVWTAINHKEGLAPTDNFQLIVGREDALKGVQLLPSARSFGDARESMQFAGLHTLSRSALTKGIPIIFTHGTWVVPVAPGPHGDDGSRAAQVVLVLDGDDTSFALVVKFHRPSTHLKSFTVPTFRRGHPNHDHVHLQSPLGVKLFI